MQNMSQENLSRPEPVTVKLMGAQDLVRVLVEHLKRARMEEEGDERITHTTRRLLREVLKTRGIPKIEELGDAPVEDG